jgi:putative restriction endonuclease
MEQAAHRPAPFGGNLNLSGISRKIRRRHVLVVAVTNVEWFNLLRGLPPMDVVNFWRPGTANFKALKPGEMFYFLLSAPVRKIAGYGTFESYERMTIREAWLTFGAGNGVLTLKELQARMDSFAGTVPNSHQSDREIGCIRLSRPVFLDDTHFRTPEELGIEFAPNIVAYKTYPKITELEV